MFGFIADILTSVTSILLPVFFSYKALRTSDPAVLTPWLMYWTTLSLFLVAENQLHFILSWVPFYSWIRFGVHLYLVLPGQQGSVFIYKEYVHPFLEEHERQIDRMISEGHAKAKAAGMDVIKQAIDYVRVQVLGQPPRRPSPPPSRNVSYTTQLFNRFAMPSARDGLAAAGTTDVLSLLGKALQQTTYPDSTSRDAQARDLASSGTLVPQHLQGTARTDFVNTTRERLRVYLQAFDDEATLQTGTTSATATPPRSPAPQSRKSYLSQPHRDSGRFNDLSRSRSESEFEDLGYETMPDPEQYRVSEADQRRPPAKDGPGWSTWVWGNYGEKDSAANPRKDL